MIGIIHISSYDKMPLVNEFLSFTELLKNRETLLIKKKKKNRETQNQEEKTKNESCPMRRIASFY